jgi:hypothetical protein
MFILRWLEKEMVFAFIEKEVCNDQGKINCIGNNNPITTSNILRTQHTAIGIPQWLGSYGYRSRSDPQRGCDG